jgi:iron complex outermembrane receptor protein
VTVTGTSDPILDAQEATTYEIGTRGSVPGLIWDLALYRSNIENEFQCYNAGATGSCSQVNLDKTIHQGVELGFGAALWSGIVEKLGTKDELWLHSAYTFSGFRFDDDVKWGDNELPGAPRHYLRAELLYKHPSGIYLGPNIEWVPEAFYVDTANTLSTEAYAIWGAKLGFDDGGPVTAYIEGRNLADEAHIASASIATKADYLTSALFEPGNGRAIYGGVQYKW